MKTLFSIAMASFASVCAAADPVFSFDFEKWLWLPITPAMADAGRSVLKAGGELSYEHRGPLFRVPEGFVLPAGRMITGAEAFHGTSALLDATAADLTVGPSRPFGRLFASHQRYHYRVALKGRGTFHFHAIASGTDPTTGKTVGLGSPELITLSVTAEWKVQEGEFELPDLSKPPYRMEEPLSAQIAIAKGDRVFLDDFTVEKK